MRYYPAWLDLRGTPCLVVGGGAVAWRKARALVACGARVTVVSPRVADPLVALGRRRLLRVVRRPFRARDLRGVLLVVAATDDQAVNEAVFRGAQRRLQLVNVVDQPARCSFIVPSVMRRGALTIAISTSGVSPALSKWMRRDLTARYGPWVGRVLSRMRRARRQVHRRSDQPSVRKRWLEHVLAEALTRAGVR